MKNQIFTVHLIFLLLFSSNLSAQWESIGSGLSLGQRDIFSISVIDENVIWAIPISTTFSATYLFSKTTNGGMTWQEGSLPDTIGNYYTGNIFAINENTAWVVMINLPQQDRVKIFKTNDGGISWEEQAGEFNEVGHAFAALHFFNENEGVGFGSPGTGNQAIDSLQIFRTIDGGDNWNRIHPSTLPEPLAGEGVWVYSGNNSYEAKGDTLWFVTRASRVFRSTDKGNSWEAFDVGISGGTNYPGLASIAFENATNGMAVTYLPNKASRTTDGGETWTEITIPVSPRLGGIEYIPNTENMYLIYDGIQGSSNMLLTIDGGNTWETITYSPSMDCLQFLSPTIGFGGGSVNTTENLGIYKWNGDLSTLSTTATHDLFVASDLVSTFPNPATEQLTLSLEEDAFDSKFLTIEVFAIDGQVVHKEEYLNSEKIEIPINNLTKGVYTIRIRNNKNSSVHTFLKM